MFSTGLSAISNTRYLQRVNTGQTRRLQHDTWTSATLVHRSTQECRASAAHSVLPKRVREIRLDKIGFDVLADTHDVCYALCLKNWQLDEDNGEKKVSHRTFLKHHWWNAVKTLPCFSLQQSRDLKTDLVISPENETKWCIQAPQTNVPAFSRVIYGMFKSNKTFFAILSFIC